MAWYDVDDTERRAAYARMAEEATSGRMSDAQLRDAIAAATGQERLGLITEALARTRTYPRSWLPPDALQEGLRHVGNVIPAGEYRQQGKPS